MTCPNCKAGNAEDARFCGVCGHTLSATEASNPRMQATGIGEAPSLVGREIAGRYRMQAKLGEGGMGAVYKAEQISLKRTVAVKLLRPEVAGSQMLLRRFNAEAEAVAKLSHPNTVNIYDFGQDSDGTLFIAMEFIEGRSLRDVIHQEAPLPVRRSLAIAAQVAASLTDAHANQIVHRDLKPDNVMLQDRGRQRDVVRVLDFGIAKLRDENRQSQMAMTQAGDMLGTPQYMSPEQIRGEHVDGRTDIYSLGGLLYEMVTGRLPFEAPTVMALLSKHLLESIVPPSQRRPDLNLPPAIDMLILNAMAKDPNARPATMEQFGEEIAAVLATFPPETGQNTAQATAQATAQQPVQTRSQAAVTPPAYSAAGAAGGPPPGGFAPPVTPPPGGFAPPGAFAPPPPGGFAPQTPPPQGGFAPQPSPPQGAFASPASMVAPPYDPHAHAHAPPSATEITRSSGGKGIWVLLGLLVVAGIGTGVYFGVLRKTGKPTPEQPTPGSNVAETPPGTPDAQVETPPPTAPDAAVLDPSNDPWAKGGGSTTVPSNGSNAITDHVGDDTDDDPGGDDEPTPPRAPRPAGQGMPAECEAYAQTLEVMAKCDKLPAQSRDAMKQAVQQMRKTYSSMKLTGAMRKQLVDACVQGDEASKQSIAGLGCSP